MTKKKAAVLLADGFEELEAMGPIDMLKRAGVEVDLISVENKDSVTGRSDVTFTPVIKMKDYDFDSADALILPGGAGHVTLKNSPEVKEQILKFYNDPNRVLSAICASPTIFGHMGLLKDKNYTCFTSMNEDFGGTYLNEYAVIDGNLVTGKSAAATVDFGLALVRALLGKEKEAEIAESIYY